MPPEKAIWTDADFDRMGWHDAALHAVAVEPDSECPGRLLLDLDYIVDWIKPEPPAIAYQWWLCPSTLVFASAWNLVGDISIVRQAFEPGFDRITRSEPDEHGYRDWTINGHEFTLTVRSPGFTQYLRQPPMLSTRQRLTSAERGGLSFSERAYE